MSEENEKALPAETTVRVDQDSRPATTDTRPEGEARPERQPQQRRGRRRYPRGGRRNFSSDNNDRDDRNNHDAPPEAEPMEGAAAEGEGGEPREPEFGDGIIEISGKGFGFLRDGKRNFVQTPQDIFVTPEIVRRFNLRDGMWIHGETRRGNRGPQLTKLLKVNDDEPTKYSGLRPFEELTTINPNKRIKLETVPDRYTTRIMDMMTPLGMGQRGLIVAPPRTGKTTLLHHIADAVVKNHPEMKLIILLVDERPEEVTDFRRSCPQAEIMASSNDSDIKSHTRIAMLAAERAKRLVEAGKHVFILLDSITRTARAFNNATGGGGRTMSGGIDARAMETPRKIFAAARNTEEAGSLTIVATALIETGSRMDEL
ncbi:MAG: transcription termination factor Rho, partial [Verrucomicrobiota bacterium]